MRQVVTPTEVDESSLLFLYMKKIYNRAKQSLMRAWFERRTNRIQAKQLKGEIKRLRRECGVHGEQILEKIAEVSDSVEVIAREMARQSMAETLSKRKN